LNESVFFAAKKPVAASFCMMLEGKNWRFAANNEGVVAATAIAT
jgi:hypothetical protein